MLLLQDLQGYGGVADDLGFGLAFSDVAASHLIAALSTRYRPKRRIRAKDPPTNATDRIATPSKWGRVRQTDVPLEEKQSSPPWSHRISITTASKREPTVIPR